MIEEVCISRGHHTDGVSRLRESAHRIAHEGPRVMVGTGRIIQSERTPRRANLRQGRVYQGSREGRESDKENEYGHDDEYGEETH